MCAPRACAAPFPRLRCREASHTPRPACPDYADEASAASAKKAKGTLVLTLPSAMWSETAPPPATKKPKVRACVVVVVGGSGRAGWILVAWELNPRAQPAPTEFLLFVATEDKALRLAFGTAEDRSAWMRAIAGACGTGAVAVPDTIVRRGRCVCVNVCVCARVRALCVCTRYTHPGSRFVCACGLSRAAVVVLVRADGEAAASFAPQRAGVVAGCRLNHCL